MIVRVAKAAKSTPRPGSNRSTDFTSATEATWTRSSSGSPRCRKRPRQLMRQSEVGSDQLLARGRVERPELSSSSARQTPARDLRPAHRHSACPPRRLRNHARTEPSWLSRPCSSTRASRICWLSRATSSPSGPGPSAAAAPLESALHPDGVVQHGELQAEVPVLRVAALQGEQAELADRQTEVLELLDVEAGTRRDRAGDQSGQHDEITPRRKLAARCGLPPPSISVASVIGAPASCEGVGDREHVGEARDLEDLHDARVGHDDVEVAAQLPTPLERADQHAERGRVQEGDPERSRTTVASPSAMTRCRHSRSCGAVATSISPLTAITGGAVPPAPQSRNPDPLRPPGCAADPWAVRDALQWRLARAFYSRPGTNLNLLGRRSSPFSHAADPGVGRAADNPGERRARARRRPARE